MDIGMGGDKMLDSSLRVTNGGRENEIERGGGEGDRLPSKKARLINEVEDMEVGRLLVPSTSRLPTPSPH
jgi:hypothetical protein